MESDNEGQESHRRETDLTQEPDEGNEAGASPSLSTNLDELAAASPDSPSDADPKSTACAVHGERGFKYDAYTDDNRCSEMDATNATSRNRELVEESLTIEEIINTFDELGLSDSSKIRYQQAVTAAMRDVDGIDPAEWTEEQLREWAKKVRQRAPSSVAVEFSAMKNYLMVKGRNDLLAIHYIWRVSGLGMGKRMRDVSDRTVPQSTVDELRGFWYKEMDNPKNSWTRTKRLAVCLTFLETGMRAVGASYLRVQDLDFERNRVHIYKTKRAKARTIPVDVCYLVAMRKYLSAREERINVASYPKELKKPTAPLFFKELGPDKGGAMDPSVLSNTIAEESKKVTGESFYSHAFRHARATEMLRAGLTEKQLQDYMGHSDFSTTAIYVHLTADDLDRAYRTKNGNGGTKTKKADDEPKNPIDIAVDALTEQFINGNLDPNRYAAAVKALKQ